MYINRTNLETHRNKTNYRNAVVSERSASKINKQPPALNERSARASEASSAREAIYMRRLVT